MPACGGGQSVAGGAPADRLLRRGQEVHPIVDQRPQPIEHQQILGSVVPVVERVLVGQVVVLRRDGRVVILAIGPGAGDEDSTVSSPGAHRLVEELAAAVEVRSHDLERIAAMAASRPFNTCT